MIFRSASPSGLKGEPMSLSGPDLIATELAPILSIVPVKLKVLKITPIDPTTVVGCAMIRSAAQLT